MGLALVSLAVATLLGAVPVAAADPGTPPYLTASGNYGVFALIDNPTFSGATCIYHPGTHPDLYRIKVRRPVVFAYDRHKSSVDRQTVGWSYVIEQSDDLTTWDSMYTSSVQTKTATDATNADFRPRTHTFTSAHPYYRVKVKIVWLHDGHVDGKGTIYPFYYGIDAGFTQFYPWYCPVPLA